MSGASLMVPPREYLLAALDYDPETGVLTWKERPRSHFNSDRGWNSFNRRDAGTPAGHKRADGRSTVNLQGVQYYAHRIIWTMMTGEQAEYIDHINLDPSDNRFANLRSCTHIENSRNRDAFPRSKSGVRGVFKQGKRWMAQIRVEGRARHIGCFDTMEQAAAAYAEQSRIHHGQFGRTVEGSNAHLD